MMILMSGKKGTIWKKMGVYQWMEGKVNKEGDVDNADEGGPAGLQHSVCRGAHWLPAF